RAPGEHHEPEHHEDEPAQGEDTEPRHYPVGRQVDVTVCVPQNDVGPRKSQWQHPCLAGDECDNHDDIEEHRCLEQVCEVPCMHPEGRRLVAIAVQPEELWIDFAVT